MGELDPTDRADYTKALNRDPKLKDEFVRRGGKLQTADVRAFRLAYIGLGIGLVLSLVVALVFHDLLTAGAVYLVWFALNFWFLMRGFRRAFRERDRNKQIVAAILEERRARSSHDATS